MANEIIKQESMTAIQALRQVATLDGDDGLAIAKIAVKEGKTGLAARGLSLIQRWNEERFWEAFLDEIEEMRQAGRIREDLKSTDAGVSSVREFFELIGGKPDEEHFRAFCALFMSANAPDTIENQAILDLELMRILRTLSAGEMHLLAAVLEMERFTIGEDLMVRFSKYLGYRSDALVNKNMVALTEQMLVSRKNWESRAGNPGQEIQFLTDLGLALKRRAQKYNQFKQSQNNATSAE